MKKSKAIDKGTDKKALAKERLNVKRAKKELLKTTRAKVAKPASSRVNSKKEMQLGGEEEFKT